MKNKTLFFPLALAVLNFGCLHTSSADYPELKKAQKEFTAQFGISPDEAEKQCDSLLSDMETLTALETKALATRETKDMEAYLVRKQDIFMLCNFTAINKILRKDYSKAKNYLEKVCAMEEVSCKKMVNEDCSSGDSSACEVKKALGY